MESECFSIQNYSKALCYGAGRWPLTHTVCVSFASPFLLIGLKMKERREFFILLLMIDHEEEKIIKLLKKHIC